MAPRSSKANSTIAPRSSKAKIHDAAPESSKEANVYDRAPKSNKEANAIISDPNLLPPKGVRLSDYHFVRCARSTFDGPTLSSRYPYDFTRDKTPVRSRKNCGHVYKQIGPGRDNGNQCHYVVVFGIFHMIGDEDLNAEIRPRFPGVETSNVDLKIGDKCKNQRSPFKHSDDEDDNDEGQSKTAVMSESKDTNKVTETGFNALLIQTPASAESDEVIETGSTSLVQIPASSDSDDVIETGCNSLVQASGSPGESATSDISEASGSSISDSDSPSSDDEGYKPKDKKRKAGSDGPESDRKIKKARKASTVLESSQPSSRQYPQDLEKCHQMLSKAEGKLSEAENKLSKAEGKMVIVSQTMQRFHSSTVFQTQQLNALLDFVLIEATAIPKTFKKKCLAIKDAMGPMTAGTTEAKDKLKRLFPNMVRVLEQTDEFEQTESFLEFVSRPRKRYNKLLEEGDATVNAQGIEQGLQLPKKTNEVEKRAREEKEKAVKEKKPAKEGKKAEKKEEKIKVEKAEKKGKKVKEEEQATNETNKARVQKRR
ncbi:MAG: hypothetical protein Q9199_001856 [Rusavskia elegans]